MLIRGTDLTRRQRGQVLAAFVHRHTVEHPRNGAVPTPDGITPTPTDAEWLAVYAFEFIRDGSRLSCRTKFAHYVGPADGQTGGPSALASDRTCAALFDAFLADTSDDYPGWDRLLVLADACDDARDDATAACLRWAAGNRKRPRWSGGRDATGWPQWYGIEKESYMLSELDPESDLPLAFYRHLPYGEYEYNGYRKDYATTRDAWLALAAGWRAAVASGWEPCPFAPPAAAVE